MHMPAAPHTSLSFVRAAFLLCWLLPGVALPHAQAAERTDEALPTTLRFSKLVIEKEKRTLTAFAGDKAVRSYRVALGGQPVGPKETEGDQKTPEGSYTVDGKNPHSRYHKNLGVSYPSPADRKRASALGKSPGGDIKIHGLGPRFRHLGTIHWTYDWTLGCIAVTDEEIDELYRHTDVGARIEIRP